MFYFINLNYIDCSYRVPSFFTKQFTWKVVYPSRKSDVSLFHCALRRWHVARNFVGGFWTSARGSLLEEDPFLLYFAKVCFTWQAWYIKYSDVAWLAMTTNSPLFPLSNSSDPSTKESLNVECSLSVFRAVCSSKRGTRAYRTLSSGANCPMVRGAIKPRDYIPIAPKIGSFLPAILFARGAHLYVSDPDRTRPDNEESSAALARP